MGKEKHHVESGKSNNPLATHHFPHLTLEHLTPNHMKLNSPAPTFTLTSAEGEQVSLGEVLKSGNALLVFLRHLG